MIVLSEATAVLARTPATLRDLLGGLPDAWLDARIGDASTFSPRDVVGHLIDGEKTDWIPRLRQILDSGDREPFPPFDRVGFRETLAGWRTSAMLDVFERMRAGNLAILEGLALSPEQLALPGLHPELGRVTLGELLATWVVHDLNHLDQIARVMSARYAKAVGPWRAYLGVLKSVP